jgi:hypothetical protein
MSMSACTVPWPLMFGKLAPPVSHSAFCCASVSEPAASEVFVSLPIFTSLGNSESVPSWHTTTTTRCLRSSTNVSAIVSPTPGA